MENIQAQIRRVGVLSLMFFGMMVGIGLLVFSQPTWGMIFRPWSFIFVVDLIPIEGFNTDANGYPIKTEFRQNISIAVNIVIHIAGFWLASIHSNPIRRRIVQGVVFAVFALWYSYMFIAAMFVGP